MQQVELAKFTSEHFPELPIAHPELGILEFSVRICNVCRFHCTPISYCALALKCESIQIQNPLRYIY